MFMDFEGLQNIMKKPSQTSHEFCSLNHSPSKMSYSFSKELRFRIPKIENTNLSVYEISRELNNRSTGFGYGKKSNIILPSLHNPSPDCYHLESDLVIQQKNKKGVVFGESRDKVNSGYLGRKEVLPGPGQYDLNRSSLIDINFKMKGEKSRSFFREKDTPGPGEYDCLGLYKSGSSVLSSVKSSGGIKINPLKEKSNRNSCSPGPGEYNIHCKSPQKGYADSKLRNSQKCIFPRTIRLTGFLKQNLNPGPGPGAYNSHSQFS